MRSSSPPPGAIDGAHVWRRSQEGPTRIQEGQFQDRKAPDYTPEDYRFTAAKGAIYAVAMKCPPDGCFTVKALADSPDQNQPEFQGIISDVKILGSGQKPSWRKDAQGLHVSAPGVHSDYPVVLKIMVE